MGAIDGVGALTHLQSQDLATFNQLWGQPGSRLIEYSTMPRAAVLSGSLLLQYDGAAILNPEAKQALSQRLAGLDK